MAQQPPFEATGPLDGTAPHRPADPPDVPDVPDVPEGDALSGALRQVLTLTQLSRAALAERLRMPRSHVEAVEHVIMAQGAGAPIGPVELSRRLGVTSAAGTQSVNRLVTDGHLTRAPHPEDGRRQVLDVTDSGFRHVMGELAPLLGLLVHAADDLDDQERAAAQRYLERVAAAYRRYLAADTDTDADTGAAPGAG
ncbi:MarR family transcriptional regulator [Kitasatospora sp. MMS16-BH015]|uniref:MarR family winged helix-turn-helix transcriptional regulator n=1 Tax=Kitasatospora sp. MMS16-BH015 TaxID=2018025 RepID=UPI000CA38CBA|nr:MarR family winged helix-turn-helix transcriptional regulator [Kitasatospora sp. MMS16-BH015]AUG75883.1 MarR family transcriptional regulator [Kitasatospora sp. MMS16-BH015]